VLERTCAVLGVRLVHSRPYSPEGRGKQERLNRVIRERFLLEAELAGIADMDQLNDRFTAWAESYLNCRVHSETGQTPISRFQTLGSPPGVDPQLLQHHLALAGRTDPLFADDAISRLHRAASGLPRALNNAAVAALIAAAGDGKALVDDACAKKAVAELTKE
jgi:Integrase core domain